MAGQRRGSSRAYPLTLHSHHPTRSVPPNFCRGDFVAFVGAALMPPGYFPHGEITSAQSADNEVSNIFRSYLTVSCRNMVYLQHCYITWPNRFCPEICHVGGRIISAPTRSVPPNHRVEISGRCRGGATHSESKLNDRRGRSLNNSTDSKKEPAARHIRCWAVTAALGRCGVLQQASCV